MLTLAEKREFVIDVGRLSSVPQLIGRIAGSLRQFTMDWRAKARTRVVWDLRNLQAGAIDPAALATFCASAKRLRQFTWTRPLAYAPSLDAQRFLHGIGFLNLVRENDLFEFREGAIGSYGLPKFHPATQVFCIRRIPETLPDSTDHERLGDWKDQCREEFREQMLYGHNCYRLFIPGELPHPLDADIVNAILNSCAEFATNAVLWGRADAFVAIQVGSRAFTASVCDAGDGLLGSLCEKKADRLSRKPIDDHEAAFFASVFNRRAMGLFHTITGVLKRGGSVAISSGIAEVHWRPALWRRVRLSLEADREVVFSPDSPRKLLGDVVHGRVEADQYSEGIRREWKPGLRGTRIAFRLPFGA